MNNVIKILDEKLWTDTSHKELCRQGSPWLFPLPEVSPPPSVSLTPSSLQVFAQTSPSQRGLPWHFTKYYTLPRLLPTTHIFQIPYFFFLLFFPWHTHHFLTHCKIYLLMLIHYLRPLWEWARTLCIFPLMHPERLHECLTCSRCSKKKKKISLLYVSEWIKGCFYASALFLISSSVTLICQAWIHFHLSCYRLAMHLKCKISIHRQFWEILRHCIFTKFTF